MTAQTILRYGFSVSLMVAAMVAIAIAGTAWAQGSSRPVTMPNSTKMDVEALVTGAYMADLPVGHVEFPF